MQRRGFLALLTGATAAIVAPPTKSYFFGGWAPNGWFSKQGLAYVHQQSPGLEGAGFAISQLHAAEAQEWLTKYRDYLRGLASPDPIERTLAAQFIPQIWSQDILEALTYQQTILANMIARSALPRLGSTISIPRYSNLTVSTHEYSAFTMEAPNG